MSGSGTGKKVKAAKKPQMKAEVKPEKPLSKKEVTAYRAKVLLVIKEACIKLGVALPEISCEADPVDQADSERDFSLDSRARERLQRLVRKGREVLAVMERGGYGICRECGEKIPRNRLDAEPVSLKCLDCKKESERREKHNQGRPHQDHQEGQEFVD